MLDLRYEKSDIEEMADEGIDALARANSEAVLETLGLFVEVLGYDSVPAEVLVNDCVMFGASHSSEGLGEAFGPIVMYNDKTNILRLIKERVSVGDSTERDIIPGVALGEVKPGAEDRDVFIFLTEKVLERDQPTIH